MSCAVQCGEFLNVPMELVTPPTRDICNKRLHPGHTPRALESHTALLQIHQGSVLVDAKQLCFPARAALPFTAEHWTFEEKHDGVRVLVRHDAGGVALLSRTGEDLAPGFPEVTDALARLSHATLDGELVVPDAWHDSPFERS